MKLTRVLFGLILFLSSALAHAISNIQETVEIAAKSLAKGTYIPEMSISDTTNKKMQSNVIGA